MIDLPSFVEKLDKILDAVEANDRKKLVYDFQETVWNTDNTDDVGADPVMEVLRDLAYDLEYYVADPKVRGEDPSFYGEDRLEREIKNSLSLIEKLT